MKLIASQPVTVIFTTLMATLFAAGCADHAQDMDQTGNAEISIAALSAAEVAKVNLTISGPAIDTPLNYSLFTQGNAWGGIVGGIPAGSDYTFIISALDQNDVAIYHGDTAGIAILAGKTVQVVIVAQQISQPLPFQNAAPVLDSLLVSATQVAPSGMVSLAAAAHDPDAGDTLTFQWSATGGSFAEATAASTTWTSPTVGTFTLTLTVTDSRGASTGAATSVTVASSNAKGTADVTVTMNDSPVISNLVAAPGFVQVGTPTTLTVTAADPNGDGLGFLWSTACAGTFANPATAATTFTLSSSGSATGCTFHVVVNDGHGGTTFGDLVVASGEPVFNQAPVVTSTVQSSSSAYLGETITLRVDASDPEGAPLSFVWSTSTGGLTNQINDANGSTITFTAPSNDHSNWTVSLLATDPLGAKVQQDLAVANLGPSDIEFVFTSDAHYGISRAAFRGATAVAAQVVNAALVARINTIQGVTLPTDNGVRAGLPVGVIDFVAEGGDVANRMEVASAVQSDAISWAQYTADYINGLALTDHYGVRSPLFTIPGNHDVTNAIGFYKLMSPLIDATSMVEIFNAFMSPAVPRTPETYNYATDKIHYSRTFGGVHFAFINMWPDIEERAWLESDMATLDPHTPIFLLVHDQPDIETKHLTNPNGDHGINATDKFENMTTDIMADLPANINTPSLTEQRQLVAFLKMHRNIVAYLHGNSHIQEMIDYTGPDNDIALATFSVDSPMKGSVSATDETKLAFNLGSIDVANKRFTMREVRWNSDPAAADGGPIQFATSRTVSLVVP